MAGWFGKLPFLGDFASRRLPPAFIRPWDDWLQSVVYGSRAQLGERWLGAYLHSPVWRFVLQPGVCGASCWIGVICPSVDRANRHFPFALAHPVEAGMFAPAAAVPLARFVDALEVVALDALDVRGSVDALEQALAALTPPRPAAVEGLGDITAADPGDCLGRLVAVDAERLDRLLITVGGAFTMGQRPHSLWWTLDEDRTVVTYSEGLPAADHYTAMLGDGGLPR